MQKVAKPSPGRGVRGLTLRDQAPDCEIHINKKIYDLKEIVKNKKVVDIGCGFGHNRKIVEEAGGEWVGVEPFEGGNHTVVGDAENLPFAEATFDVAIMDAVLEHIPDVGKAFKEVSRVLKPGGIFVGYSAFMECFHEISYSHLSFRALQHYAQINGMKLKKISGGSRFGIDYHLNVLFYPLSSRFMRWLTACWIRGMIRAKSFFVYCALRLIRREKHREARETCKLYFKIECLRQSTGFTFVIENMIN